MKLSAFGAGTVFVHMLLRFLLSRQLGLKTMPIGSLIDACVRSFKGCRQIKANGAAMEMFLISRSVDTRHCMRVYDHFSRNL